MLLRPLIASVVTAVVVSAAAARPVFDQMVPANSAVPSQERVIGADTRAADDFVLPLGNGLPHRVAYIQVEMIGNGVPNVAKFGVTIFRNDPLIPVGRPGLVVATRLGATAFALLGPTGVPGMNKYLVTFAVPSGAITLAPNTRYWVSGFGRLDDTRWWGFGRKVGPIALTPGRYNGVYPLAAAWSMFQPFSDNSFRIITVQP